MKKILAIFLSWRIFITLAMIGGLILPVKLGFLGGGDKNYFQSPLTWSFANFDGVHYLSIAAIGYQQFQQAFFPFYPLLIKILSLITEWNYINSALLISHIAFIAALYCIYKLLELDYGKKTYLIVALFLLFPASFYFGSVYTESLFLFFSCASFLAARKEKWLLAGIFGALASATKLVGIFLLPALIIEYYFRRRYDAKWIWLLLIPIGLFVYMFWLNLNYHDPFYFYHAHSAFSAGRSTGSLVLLPQVYFRYAKILFTTPINYQYFIAAAEFFISSATLLLLIKGFNLIRRSYLIYSLLLFIVPTFSGTFLSMPRLAAVNFPLFIILFLLLKSRRQLLTLYAFFGIGLLLFCALFTRGYWIA